MSYRDDRDAMRERIQLLERKAAQAVAPEELSSLREELAAAKARLDRERETIEGILAKLGDKTPVRAVRVRVLAGMLVALFCMSLGMALWLATQPAAPTYEGAANSVRARPVRREVDVEIARLMPDLDGCMPEGHEARILVEILFEGRDGRIRDITPRNISEHDSYPATTPECLRSVLLGVSTASFSEPTYRYHLTLEWSEGRLQTPPLWARHDLARDPRGD